jgi:hypothetical protein
VTVLSAAARRDCEPIPRCLDDDPSRSCLIWGLYTEFPVQAWLCYSRDSVLRSKKPSVLSYFLSLFRDPVYLVADATQPVGILFGRDGLQEPGPILILCCLHESCSTRKLPTSCSHAPASGTIFESSSEIPRIKGPVKSQNGNSHSLFRAQDRISLFRSYEAETTLTTRGHGD